MLRLKINMEHPQPRHIERAAQILADGGVAVYPTDTTYGLGCDLFQKKSIERIYQIKGMDPKQRLSFICSDIADIAAYAQVDNIHYRILRQYLPGPYTFVLPASKEVPRLVMTKSKTVGIRVPDNQAILSLVKELGHPLITTTVAKTERVSVNPKASYDDPDEIEEDFGHQIELLLDGGILPGQPSSIIDLTMDPPAILREGAGDVSWLR